MLLASRMDGTGVKCVAWWLVRCAQARQFSREVRPSSFNSLIISLALEYVGSRARLALLLQIKFLQEKTPRLSSTGRKWL